MMDPLSVQVKNLGVIVPFTLPSTQAPKHPPTQPCPHQPPAPSPATPSLPGSLPEPPPRLPLPPVSTQQAEPAHLLLQIKPHLPSHTHRKPRSLWQPTPPPPMLPTLPLPLPPCTPALCPLPPGRPCCPQRLGRPSRKGCSQGSGGGSAHPPGASAGSGPPGAAQPWHFLRACVCGGSGAALSAPSQPGHHVPLLPALLPHRPPQASRAPLRAPGPASAVSCCGGPGGPGQRPRHRDRKAACLAEVCVPGVSW